MNKNKKGASPVGIILTVFVGLMVALAIYTGGIAPNVGKMTLEQTVTGQAFTMPALGTAKQIATGYQSIRTVVITNATSGAVVDSANYTITNYKLVDGALAVTILNNSDDGGYFTRPVNLSYVGEPLGYVKEGGSRSLVTAMVLLIVLAIVVIAISPQIKELADKF